VEEGILSKVPAGENVQGGFFLRPGSALRFHHCSTIASRWTFAWEPQLKTPKTRGVSNTGHAHNLGCGHHLEVTG